MKIGIGNDHRGYELKKQIADYLKQNNYEVINYGSDSTLPVDYPIYAFTVGEAVSKKEIDFGILICRTGIGMSIAANKVKGVRCGKVDTKEEAKLCRIDNNCNIMTVSYEKTFEETKELIDAFLKTEFTMEERHCRRINLIDSYNV